MVTHLVCASHSPLLHCYAKEPQDWKAMQKAYQDRANQIKEFDPENNLTGASRGRGLEYFSNPGTRSILTTLRFGF